MILDPKDIFFLALSKDYAQPIEIIKRVIKSYFILLFSFTNIFFINDFLDNNFQFLIKAKLYVVFNENSNKADLYLKIQEIF